MNQRQLAQYIDHTLLRADATREDILQLVQEALQYETYSVCVNSGYVNDAVKARAGHTTLHIAATVGFPFGQASTTAKATEARVAVDQGSDEIDLVWNLGLFLSHDEDAVYDDIQAVVEAVGGVPVKVILETARLTTDQITRGGQLAVKAGAQMVKTSTGFGFAGATQEAVKTLRTAVGPNVGVKASGGIRTYQDALAMIQAGATRLGLSGTGAVLAEADG